MKHSNLLRPQSPFLYLIGFIVAVSTAGANASTSVTEGGLAISNLHCIALTCTDQEKPVNTSSWCTSVVGSLAVLKDVPLTATSASTPDQVSVEQSDDSDQYETYTFSLSDLKNLNAKSVDSIRAAYSDAYDWADGHHIRYTATFRCAQ